LLKDQTKLNAEDAEGAEKKQTKSQKSKQRPGPKTYSCKWRWQRLSRHG